MNYLTCTFDDVVLIGREAIGDIYILLKEKESD